MKSWIATITSGAFLAQMLCAGVAFAGAPQPTVVEATAQQGAAMNAKPDAGGFTPCLLTCYLGPRVGTEWNEGRGVATMEWLQLIYIGKIILAFKAMGGTTMTEYAKENGLDSRPIPPPKGAASAEKGGFGACLIALYLGPRVAMEKNEGRKIRGKDILVLILGIGVILQALEARAGKTMTQIAKDEGLDG